MNKFPMGREPGHHIEARGQKRVQRESNLYSGPGTGWHCGTVRSGISLTINSMTLIQRAWLAPRLALTPLLCACLAIGSAPGHTDPARPTVPSTLDGISVYAVSQLDGTEDTLNTACSVPAQNWIRAWYKWGFAPDWMAQKAAVLRCHDAGALFGGGISCSDLFRYENGLTDTQFQDFATRDPYGRLYPVQGFYYHGSIANPAYLNYVMGWAIRQVDAGADTLFMEDPAGGYSVHEGYDPDSLAAFSQYLLDRFVTGAGWKAKDPRWKSKFHVDMADPEECPDHTILSFNYAAYLQKNHWAGNPSTPANPLAPIWGSAGDINLPTFCSARANTAWRYWTTGIRAYARQHQRQVWICASTPAHWADYQCVPVPEVLIHSGANLPAYSNFTYWIKVRRHAQEIAGGMDVPVVAYLPWARGGPWEQLTHAQRNAWITRVVPEMYAAGLFFAYPVHGQRGCAAASNGTLTTIQQQARFVRAVGSLLHHVKWQDRLVASYTGAAQAFVEGQQNDRRLIVHIMGRAYNGLNCLTQENREMQLALGARPVSVKLYTQDHPLGIKTPWFFQPAEGAHTVAGSGVLTVHIPSLTTWDIVSIRLDRWNPLPVAED